MAEFVIVECGVFKKRDEWDGDEWDGVDLLRFVQ
jgi:hypothetical protein